MLCDGLDAVAHVGGFINSYVQLLEAIITKSAWETMGEKYL
jgi:hypothetical protein